MGPEEAMQARNYVVSVSIDSQLANWKPHDQLLLHILSGSRI